MSTNLKRTRRIVVWLLCILLALSTVFFSAIVPSVFATTDIESGSSFSTDVIYQIVTDRFSNGNPDNDPRGKDIYDTHEWGSPNRDNRLYHGGDWQGITDKINDGYFTDMGITALWISSPIENLDILDPADKSAEWTGSSYHGYWGRDFFETNPYFGTKQEFQALINNAHSKDIKIVIDFAPNHTSTTTDFTAPLDTAKYPEDGGLYKNGSLVGKVHDDQNNNYFNHQGWINNWDSLEEVTYNSMYGLADLNQMNNTIDKYMKDSINMWLDMGIDGIRVDAVKHMPLGWQKNWVSDIYEKNPVFVFGEWFDGAIAPDESMKVFANESGMSLLDFNFANATRNAIGSLSGTMYDVHNSITATAEGFKQVNNQVTFIDNHDMSRFMTLSSNTQSSVDTAYVLQLTQRGVPAIYYGSEQYLTGANDPDNRGDMLSFNKQSTAYQIISKLAPLRKSNPALAYGTYSERWINNDVYVYERQFGNSVVVTAINRNTSQGYNLSNIKTNMPSGTYQDALEGIKSGHSLTVYEGGNIPSYFLGAGACAVWEYTAPSESSPIIGNVDPLIGKTGNTVTISGRGFSNNIGRVLFGATDAKVVSWSDSKIQVTIPTIVAGTYDIKVINSIGVSSGSYPGFKVLSGSQTAVRFKVNNAYTLLGENVYLVGSVDEIGNWNPNHAVGPLYNSTQSIGQYPTWFFDVSVPKDSIITYKFIKKDSMGNVIWEGGQDHVLLTKSTTCEIVVNWQN